MTSSSNSIPVSYIQSYHFKERELYARLVIDLHMDPTRTMEIIAFWLWQEEKGHANIIQRVSSLNDANLVEVAVAAQAFVEVVRTDPLANQPNQGLCEEALQGIEYYLTNVCRKALDDIRRRAEEEANLRRMRSLVHQMSQVNINLPNNIINNNTGRNPFGSIMSVGDFDSMSLYTRPMINHQPYVPHGEGTSRGVYRRANGLSISNTERSCKPYYPFDMILGDKHEIPQFLDHRMVDDNLYYHVGSISRWPLPQKFNTPREERTLFVTFSNGYPLSEEELYTFFMRYFGDVESVTIEERDDDKPPLYAHVIFYSLRTVLRILDGNQKVKFITNGKHLWARRFYPKRNKDKAAK